MPSTQASRQILIAGVAQLELRVCAEQIDRLLTYVAALQRWSQRMNLISRADDSEVIRRHLLDSLSILPFVTQGRHADIGSGAGLPGIPLAVCLSDRDFTLLDSRQRRCEFVQHVVHVLGLTNVEIVCARVENYRPETKFDTLVSRAFMPLDRLVTTTGHLLPTASGQWLAMKGRHAQQELLTLAENYRVWSKTGIVDDAAIATALPKETQLMAEVIPLQVPGLAATRRLIRITRLPPRHPAVTTTC